MAKNTITATPSVKVRIDRLLDSGKTKAFASANISGAFAIHGIRIVDSEKGLFIAMPQDSFKKNGETKYKDIFHAITAEARTVLNEAAMEAYEQAQEQAYSENERSGMEQSM